MKPDDDNVTLLPDTVSTPHVSTALCVRPGAQSPFAPLPRRPLVQHVAGLSTEIWGMLKWWRQSKIN